jgi:MFS transporter, ACS family, hexuronate transporter
MTKYRWAICALIFFATTVNYLDRQIISLLKSTLSTELQWNDGDYANIEIAFKLFYAIGFLIAGRVIDKLGTKKGYALSTSLWSIAAMAHAAVSSVLGFAIARAALGITEAGNFPAAIKGVAEWFPKKERALATGIFNSGTNIGAILTPLSVPFIVAAYGWQMAFIITGAIGFTWLALWMYYYEDPSKSTRVSAEELNYIQNDPSNFENAEDKAMESKKIPWTKLIGYKQTWAFALGKMFTDPIWWFFLFWLPDFMESEYHLKLTGLAAPIAIVYFISSIGSIGGGYLPMYFINKGWSPFKARKTAMFIYALLVVPILFAQLAGSHSMWYAVCIIGLAAAGHQAWSANVFTTVSDMFPKNSIASVTGIGSMLSSSVSILFSLFVQKKLFVHYREIGEIHTAYYIMFAISAFAYITAWTLMHFLVPKMEKITV